MQISVSDAKAQLTDLLHRAEAGEKIVLTRHGQPVARLVVIKAAQNRKARRYGRGNASSSPERVVSMAQR